MIAMAVHDRLRSPLVLGSLALALACGDDDGATDDVATTSAGSTTASTGGSATVTASTTATSTATTAGSGSTTTAGTAADSSTGPGEPVECGDLSCSPGEYCVVPCCGGPQPGCEPLPVGGDCGTGTLDRTGECCDNDPDPPTCMQMQWCIPGPCIPNPPYCVTADMVSCNEFDCTVEGGCFGTLMMDDQLACEDCA